MSIVPLPFLFSGTQGIKGRLRCENGGGEGGGGGGASLSVVDGKKNDENMTF